MLIFVLIDAPSARLRCNQYGMRDAVGWGHPPHQFSRAQDTTLLRMIPFVERKHDLIELGPRGTGKSHLLQQVSPYAHLVSGGKAKVVNSIVKRNTVGE